MKRWWHYLLLGVIAWLLFSIWRFPASVAYDAFGASAGQLALAGVEGTLWHGSAQQLQYKGRAVAGIDWQLSPWSLLLGRAGGELHFLQDDAYLNTAVTASIGSGDIRLSAVEGRVPASLIQPWLKLVPLPLKGIVSLKLDRLELDGAGKPTAADGRVVWSEAGVIAGEPLDFGDLQLNLETSEYGNIVGTLKDSGGPLTLDAELTLQVDGSYQLVGYVGAAASAPKALRNYLALLGRADSQGNYPLDYQGKL